MSPKSTRKITILSVLSVSLITSAVTASLLAVYYRHVCFHQLGGFCESMITQNPDSRQTVLALLKTQDFNKAGENVLSGFGYTPSNIGITDTAVPWIAFFAFIAGSLLFLLSFWYLHQRSSARIWALTDYLEKINTGRQGLLLGSCEDEFSRLQDELYKTVTTLYQTREDALAARNNFAENLSNIAHQLKTPITSISLTVQMTKAYLEDQGYPYANIVDIEQQVNRLMYLEEALLLLSRIDSGTLALDRKPADVFTILSLASDNLYELSMQRGILIDVPEMGAVDINADLNWTMEAILNVMKNCIEAAPPYSAVHCAYEKNPLYVQIRIWDEGAGFAKKDLPYLFERFYRGEKAQNTGIGIGLSLSKAIIEMQDGSIRAFNLPDGGACFEIHFYSH